MSKNRKELTEAYKDLYEDVARILYEHDLMALAGPADEYEPEAGTIIARLRTARSAADVRRITHEEFVRWFNADLVGEESRYEDIAQQIWQAWQRFNNRP
jgi:hypothetical protein